MIDARARGLANIYAALMTVFIGVFFWAYANLIYHVPFVHLSREVNLLPYFLCVIGGMLLVLGLNWLRKAILRASGHKALHDEDAIYRTTVSSLSTPAGTTKSRDAVGFTVAFKGVFLEGLEVVMIVLTLGSSSRHLALAAVSAAAAVVVVGVVGTIVGRQLSEVPENAMKMVVGIMLTSFGVFWVAEGAGVRWPGSDLFLLALVGLFAATTAGAIRWMRAVLPAAVEQPR